MKSDVAIKLTHISKRYYLHSEKPTLIENVNFLKKPKEFWALKNINLTINKGDRIGLLGANGAGKTTLLKIMTGITRPTTGTVETNGNIVSLIELTAGFHPEMTGIDNIFLNGALLGISKATISERLDSIIDFADIGDFVHQPFYTYSSGMALRLGFSIATNTNPDTLLLDENLSVGDANFQNKSIKKILELNKKNKTTIVFASHQQYLMDRLKVIPFHLNKQGFQIHHHELDS